MKKKDKKRKIRCCDVILEAFIEYLNDDFIKSRKETDPSKVINPHYWEQGKFVSLEGIDKYGNIIYKETQAGTTPDFEYHIISIAAYYSEYKPYHKKWMKSIKRESKLNELGICTQE